MLELIYNPYLYIKRETFIFRLGIFNCICKLPKLWKMRLEKRIILFVFFFLEMLSETERTIAMKCLS